jgi:hypothetical protein
MSHVIDRRVHKVRNNVITRKNEGAERLLVDDFFSLFLFERIPVFLTHAKRKRSTPGNIFNVHRLKPNMTFHALASSH